MIGGVDGAAVDVASCSFGTVTAPGARGGVGSAASGDGRSAGCTGRRASVYVKIDATSTRIVVASNHAPQPGGEGRRSPTSGSLAGAAPSADDRSTKMR